MIIGTDRHETGYYHLKEVNIPFHSDFVGGGLKYPPSICGYGNGRAFRSRGDGGGQYDYHDQLADRRFSSLLWNHAACHDVKGSGGEERSKASGLGEARNIPDGLFRMSAFNGFCIAQ